MSRQTMQGRRRVLSIGLSIASCALAKPVMAAAALAEPPRHLSFYNLHTGEALRTVFWQDGAYIPDALVEIDRVLRDFRTGSVHSIDKGLLDLLTRLHQRLDTSEPFHVISGYRSPETNAILHERSDGVASHSLHMNGMAIDIRVPDRSLDTLHRAALSLEGGGVGFYPSSDFVHVDVGRVRHWGPERA
ncbi:MAG TPA: DUF882 domain-containing protein [Aliidongia sp.]|nr:DUF882 domain-containing protein [Aliidongia sp.]